MRKNRCVIMACIISAMMITSCKLNDSHNQTPDSNINTESITCVTTCCTTAESEVTTSSTTLITTDVTTVETTVSETSEETEEVTVYSELIPDVYEELNAEPVTEYVEPIVVEEYLVYKPSTYYIHKNTCRWNSGDAYRIESADGLTARLCSECNPNASGFEQYVEPEPETPSSDGLTYVGYFGRVTYYPATAYYDGVCGGSGRTLLGYGDYGNGIRGSIASRSLYETYGYNLNGRTTVYLEFPGYESMNGYYYVDDCCASYGVIDVFVWSGWSCPFYNAGVIEANCYI